jgi:hypothetical protein
VRPCWAHMKKGALLFAGRLVRGDTLACHATRSAFQATAHE